MTLHKLTAGDGYQYLIRQVVALDDTRRGRASLADYYSSKGETPGRWMGRGLASLGQPVGRDPGDPLVAEYWTVDEGSEVSEPQMKALFGEGLHPNAEKIAEILLDRGAAVAAAASRLGRPFRVDAGENAFIRRLREAYGAYNISVGAERSAKIPEEIRAEIRSALGREMFAEEHGRAPFDARELSGFVARHSASKTKAVAGYDLTFTPVKSVSVVWALAPRALARQIEQAHRRAVEVAIEFLEEHAAFTRMGSGAVAQVDTTGLIIAAFDHRDSRERTAKANIYLTHEQVFALAAEAKQYGPLILLLCYCGPRWGEVAGLRVGHIDFLKRRIKLQENAVMVGTKVVVGTLKGHKFRDIPMPRFVGDELARVCRGKGHGDILWPSRDGGYMGPPASIDSWLSGAVSRCIKAANEARARETQEFGAPKTPVFPRVTAHDLRHTAASLAVKELANPKVIQRMMGHKSAAMTLDVYADLFEDDLDLVADRLDQAVSKMRPSTSDGSNYTA